jgi:hypothetical protein
MKPSTKKFLENVPTFILYSFFYSSLLALAIQIILEGINIPIEHPMYLLIGCWAIFVLFEIIWARLKSEISELVNENFGRKN